MICAIMQPTYLPWLGYMQLIAGSDVFVFFDDVQFVRGSWHQRNRIKSGSAEIMLTVPVLTKSKLEQKINEVKINKEGNWRKKHLQSIVLNYRKTPFFQDYIGGLETIYAEDFDRLVDLNTALIKFFMDKIGIKTKTVLSSEMQVEGEMNAKIVGMCKKLGAQALYDAAGAQEILDLPYFAENNVKLIFQKYQHPVYKQPGTFMPYMSVLDLLFNEGKNSLEIINSGVGSLTHG
jgi:hypothetical protein